MRTIQQIRRFFKNTIRKVRSLRKLSKNAFRTTVKRTADFWLQEVPQKGIEHRVFCDLGGSWSMGSKVVAQATLEAPKKVPQPPIGFQKTLKCLPDLLENIVSNFKRLLDFIRNTC